MEFNNKLAMVLGASVIPALWIVQGLDIVELPGEVIGATIAAFTLIVQYYFRKKPEEGTS